MAEPKDNPATVVVRSTGTAEKTAVVLGAFRGGTSMAAQVLHELGVPMAETFAHDLPSYTNPYPNFEDRDFQRLLLSDSYLAKLREGRPLAEDDFDKLALAEVLRLVEVRNRRHRIWGWKFPGTPPWLRHTRLGAALRHPHYITVFRDFAAVVQNELPKYKVSSFVHEDGAVVYRFAEGQQRLLLEHLWSCKDPHMVISFERARAACRHEKEAMVQSVVAFLGLSSTAKQVQVAIDAIR